MQQIKQNDGKYEKSPATRNCRRKVISLEDYQVQNIHKNETGEDTNTNLPKSNVLYLI